jgi:hypothetical protein
MRITLIAGLPWLGVLTIAYVLVSRRRAHLAFPAAGGQEPAA